MGDLIIGRALDSSHKTPPPTTKVRLTCRRQDPPRAPPLRQGRTPHLDRVVGVPHRPLLPRQLRDPPPRPRRAPRRDQTTTSVVAPASDDTTSSRTLPFSSLPAFRYALACLLVISTLDAIDKSLLMAPERHRYAGIPNCGTDNATGQPPKAPSTLAVDLAGLAASATARIGVRTLRPAVLTAVPRQRVPHRGPRVAGRSDPECDPRFRGISVRNIPTWPVTARPQACDLRKHVTCLRLRAGCFGRGRVDRFASDQKVGGSSPSGRSVLRQTTGPPTSGHAVGAYSRPDGGRRSGSEVTQNVTQNVGARRVVVGRGGSLTKPRTWVRRLGRRGATWSDLARHRHPLLPECGSGAQCVVGSPVRAANTSPASPPPPCR